MIDAMCALWIRKGVAWIPTMAWTPSGWMDRPPVVGVPLAEREILVRAIADRIAAGSPRLAKAPEVDKAIPRLMGARTWSELEQTSEHWTVETLDTGVVFLVPSIRGDKPGLFPDLSRQEELPPGTKPDAIARRLVERLGETGLATG